MTYFFGNSNTLSQGFWAMGGMIPLVIWSAAWSGLALWHAAKRGEKWWFILFLLVHTAGIAEILYLIFVAKIFAKSSGKKKKK